MPPPESYDDLTTRLREEIILAAVLAALATRRKNKNAATALLAERLKLTPEIAVELCASYRSGGRTCQGWQIRHGGFQERGQAARPIRGAARQIRPRNTSTSPSDQKALAGL